MRLLLFSLIVVLAQLAHGVEARAQAAAPSCPAIKIKCPSFPWEMGDKVTVSLEVLSSDAYLTENLKYNWAVSAGEIVGGQRTTEITIDITGTAGESVTATVEIDGLPAGCDRTESCTLPIVCAPPLPTLFDKYGDISEHDEMVALDNFAAALKEQPGARGYIILYGGGNSAAAQARIGRIRNYLINEGGIESERLKAVDAGGGGELEVELYIRPTGALEPEVKPRP